MVLRPSLRVAPVPALPRHLRRESIRLRDGARTTVYVATYPLDRTRVRVVRLPRPTPLAAWCAATGTAEAMVGGFFIRAHGTPLGELRQAGVERHHVPFDEPWGAVRACLHVAGDGLRIARRNELVAAPEGDLLQAGPLLVRDGRVVFDDSDHEGFSAGCDQFDSDITDGRHPRAAIGIGDATLWVLACDGRRSRVDAGLTMTELAQAMLDLGCHTAMNLDGGGSTTLVHRRHLLNRPYSEQDQPAPASRPIVTALIL
jgi:phosphodiester glycosidase